jgi:hypothetical protein
MDYLKAFTIGSSGLTWVQHVALLALKDETEFGVSIKAYSMIAPIYFGLMTMLAFFIRSKYKFSLAKSLFLVSIISITLVTSLNYFVSSKSIVPYKNYTNNEWISYIFTNGGRHIIEFNLIIYYFAKYFSTNYWLRVFIIGSSFLSFAPTYLRVMHLDNKDKINYSFRNFVAYEATMHGVLLVLSLFIIQKLFGNNLKNNLIIYGSVTAVGWLILAYYFKTYKHKTLTQWLEAFIYVCFKHVIVIFVIYQLLTRLN